MTWKQLPSLAHGNDFWETNAGELPEVTATAGGYGNCWKLRQLLEAADGLPVARRDPQYDGKLSFYLNC